MLQERTPTRQSLAAKLETLGCTRPRQRGLLFSSNTAATFFELTLWHKADSKQWQAPPSQGHRHRRYPCKAQGVILSSRRAQDPSESLHRTVAVRSRAIPELAHGSPSCPCSHGARPSAPSSPRTSPPPLQKKGFLKPWSRSSSVFLWHTGLVHGSPARREQFPRSQRKSWHHVSCQAGHSSRDRCHRPGKHHKAVSRGALDHHLVTAEENLGSQAPLQTVQLVQKRHESKYGGNQLSPTPSV